MKCNIKNLEVNYEVYGDGKPIIMIHGMTPDLRLMTGCMEPVFKNRAGYKRIYIDLPGMGKTKGESWITNSDIVLDILIEFINKVIPNENFLLAGESYGGYLSRGIILKLANRVDGLLSLCPGVVSDIKKRNRPQHVVLKRDEELLSQLESSDAEGFNSMQVVQSKSIWERYRDEILSGVKLADYNFLDIINKNENGWEFSFALDETLNKPTSIILGRQDSCVGYKDAWNILDRYPRSTFAVLDKAGHNLQLEQVEIFNALVNEWITRVEEESHIS
jgi:pimeloyl-ACP methyl ester carboxylesterase